MTKALTVKRIENAHARPVRQEIPDEILLGLYLVVQPSGALEVFSSQQAWDDPDLYWMSLMNLVNWTCNVAMPLYGVLQIVVGVMHFAGIGHRIYQGGSWMRHFMAAAGCFMLSGIVRLAEWFVQQGAGGVS